MFLGEQVRRDGERAQKRRAVLGSVELQAAFDETECDGEPGDVWTAIDEDEMRGPIEDSDETV